MCLEQSDAVLAVHGLMFFPGARFATARAAARRMFFLGFPRLRGGAGFATLRALERRPCCPTLRRVWPSLTTRARVARMRCRLRRRCSSSGFRDSNLACDELAAFSVTLYNCRLLIARAIPGVGADRAGFATLLGGLFIAVGPSRLPVQNASPDAWGSVGLSAQSEEISSHTWRHDGRGGGEGGGMI